LILRAAVHVLAESGIEGFTMIAVSTSAGVSVGSIYRRFGGKDQLLRAAQAQYTSSFIEELTRKLDSFETSHQQDAGSRVRHAVRALVSTFRENGAAMRVLLLLGLQDAQIYEEGATASAEGGRRYGDFLDQLGPAIAHDDRAAAIDFSYRMVYASCAHRLTQGEFLESPRPLDWNELADRIAVVVESYLLRPQ
jgi:AcrR family transcriptional regulator